MRKLRGLGAQGGVQNNGGPQPEDVEFEEVK